MKQHITIEQLDELSAMGKEKLTDYIDSLGDSEYIGVHNCGTCGKSGLLSIGQMVEFLGDITTIMKLKKNGRWAVYYGEGINMDEHNTLCDALWEACKEKLNG